MILESNFLFKNFYQRKNFSFIFYRGVDILFKKAATGNVKIPPLLEASEEEEEGEKEGGISEPVEEMRGKESEGALHGAPPNLKRLRT